MGGLCQAGHDFLRSCKKKHVPDTIRTIDVLVTEHSRWTEKRVRRALFGQSFVDFSTDPWTGVKNRDDSKQQEVRQKAKKKASRMERDFSQSQSQASQAQRESQAVRDDSSDEGRDMLVEEGPEEVVPEGTVYFSDNFPVFKTFRVFNIEIFK